MNQDNNKNNQNQNRNRLNIPSNFHNYQKMLSNNKLSNFSKKSHSIRHASQSPSSGVSNDELTQEQLEEQAKQTSSQNKTIIPPIAPKPEPVKGAVEFVKTAAKKKLLIVLAPVAAQIAIAFVGILVLFLIFMTPIARLTEAGENLNSWWANVKNTFTSFCFFCKEDEIAETEQAKREEKFYKKVNKIKNAYLQGKGMDGRDGDDNFSIELDLALLVSSILYNEDLYGDNVDAMQDTINGDGFNGVTEENFESWKTDNETNITDMGFGPNPTFQSVKDQLSQTQEEMEEFDLFLGWYEAKGDPVDAIFDMTQDADDPSSTCPLLYYEYSQKEDPAWASSARKIAKHMVERKINAKCRRVADYDDDGNLTGYHWEKTVKFDYVLNVEKEQKLYTPEVHANPYPEIRTPDELDNPQHPNPYVKYMLSTYIPSKHDNLIKDEELVPTDSYLISVKNVLSDIYTYRDTYEQWLKYWEDESNGLYAGNSCNYDLNVSNNQTATAKNIKVRLLHCKSPYNPIESEELVDFEKYILGVTYAENEGCVKTPESCKVQAIAARTYSLQRKFANLGIGLKEENGEWILSLRNCESDHVYCDPDVGCHKATDQWKTTYSGPSPTGSYYKGPLDINSPIRSAVAEVTGKVLVDSDGKMVDAPYVDSDQISWNEQAANNADYFEILMKHYSDSSDIKSNICYSVSGPYSQWKQSDPSWGTITLGPGGETISGAGCLATSVAIQIARSGTQLTVSNFNPGIFVQELSKNGGFYESNFQNKGWEKIAPNWKYEGPMSLAGLSRAEKLSRIAELIDQGYYVVARVVDKQHWVAIDRVEGNELYMFDPSSTETLAWKKYSPSQTNRLHLYRKTD